MKYNRAAMQTGLAAGIVLTGGRFPVGRFGSVHPNSKRAWKPESPGLVGVIS